MNEAASPRGCFGTSQDMTERKPAEEALRESEELFRKFAENIHEVFWLSNADATQILYISPNYRVIWGRDPEAVYENPRDWTDAIHEEDRGHVRSLLAPERLQEGSVTAEFRIRRPDGEVRWISARGFPIRNENGESYRLAGIAEDITERKRVEEELAEEARMSTRFSTALENLTTGVLITDPARPDEPVIYANRGFRTVTGYAEHEVLGRNPRLLQGPETDPHTVREIGRAIEERRPFHGRVLNYRKDGTPFWNEMTISPVFDSGGELINFVGLQSDVTEQVRGEEQLQGELKEKTVLLQEVHHRVKNNLQIISSLLNMQIRTVRDPHATKALQESRSRIHAIALAHEMLYRSHSFAQVDLAAYLRKLAHRLHHPQEVGQRIELRLELQSCSTSVSQAVSCGLITSELVTNALKHSFSDGRAGEIRIALHTIGTECTLIVSDDGVGLPENFDLRQSRSVGLQLVEDLAHQLQGVLELRRGRGTEFRITFTPAEHAP